MHSFDMSAFPSRHRPCVSGSYVVPKTLNNMSSLFREGNIANRACFSPNFPVDTTHRLEVPLHASQSHESRPDLGISSSVKIPSSISMGVSTVSDMGSTEGKKRKDLERQGLNTCGPSENAEKKLRVKHDTKKKKKKKKVPDQKAQVSDYVHVRARRGQATDKHSLAERVRREKIGMRMKLLQSLVPGCDKITGKTQILDQIIRYVQALQYQLEFLGSKLSPAFPMVNAGSSTNTLVAEEFSTTELGPLPMIPFRESNPNQLDNCNGTCASTTSLLLHHDLDPRSNITSHSQDDGHNPMWGPGDHNQKLLLQYGLHNFSPF